MQKILITGGSGLIGTRLTTMLLEKGYAVAHLGRKPRNGTVRTFGWDVTSRSIDPEALAGVDGIIHLAGAGIADKRWTRKRKQEILESRTHSSRLLFEQLESTPHNVKAFVSASAIGYYGFDDNETVFKETDAPGKDFLANVVKKWEAEVDQIQTLGIRVVKIRVGIVLAKEGGALPEISKPVRAYLGAPLGSGNQKLSWVHLDDLCRMFIKALEAQEMSGPYNGVGPYAVTNRDLTNAIASALGKPLVLPAVPSFTLRILLGEMADLVLKGAAISNEKIASAGFEYQFNTLEKALDNLLKT